MPIRYGYEAMCERAQLQAWLRWRDRTTVVAATHQRVKSVAQLCSLRRWRAEGARIRRRASGATCMAADAQRRRRARLLPRAWRTWRVAAAEEREQVAAAAFEALIPAPEPLVEVRRFIVAVRFSQGRAFAEWRCRHVARHRYCLRLHLGRWQRRLTQGRWIEALAARRDGLSRVGIALHMWQRRAVRRGASAVLARDLHAHYTQRARSRGLARLRLHVNRARREAEQRSGMVAMHLYEWRLATMWSRRRVGYLSLASELRRTYALGRSYERWRRCMHGQPLLVALAAKSDSVRRRRALQRWWCRVRCAEP